MLTLYTPINLQVNFEVVREPSREDEEIFGFELCDSTPGDAFVTDVGWDPLFGTPIFRTLAGRSRCPYARRARNRRTVVSQLKGSALAPSVLNSSFA